MGVKQSDIDRAIADGNKFLAQLRRVCPSPQEVTKFKDQRIHQDNKPLLNALETEWMHWLQGAFPGAVIYKQALRWKLGNGIWYKPDFAALVSDIPTEPLRMTCWEVKGPHAYRGGLENLKVAAGLYPEVCWILAWKDDVGLWQVQKVRS